MPKDESKTQAPTSKIWTSAKTEFSTKPIQTTAIIITILSALIVCANVIASVILSNIEFWGPTVATLISGALFAIAIHGARTFPRSIKRAVYLILGSVPTIGILSIASMWASAGYLSIFVSERLTHETLDPATVGLSIAWALSSMWSFWLVGLFASFSVISLQVIAATIESSTVVAESVSTLAAGVSTLATQSAD